MNKVLSLQKEHVSKEVHLKKKSAASVSCKTSSFTSIFFC
ncbi:class III lanthipeptide [Alkalihalobacillus sp. NPDC078783]